MQFVVLALALPVRAYLLQRGQGYSLASASWVDWRILLALGLAYHSLMTGMYGWTLGKRLLGMRVVGDGRAPPGVVRGVVRAATQLASLVSLGLVFLWICWDRDRQGLHDKLAGTLVVAWSR